MKNTDKFELTKGKNFCVYKYKKSLEGIFHVFHKQENNARI